MNGGAVDWPGLLDALREYGRWRLARRAAREAEAENAGRPAGNGAAQSGTAATTAITAHDDTPTLVERQ